MLIDTHCHLDAMEFDKDRGAVIHRAQGAGVRQIIIPAIGANLETVRALAHSFPEGRYALGIHPIYVPQAKESELAAVKHAIERAIDDPRFIGIGEIGLDFFIPALREERMVAKQEIFYAEQLDMALHFDLPVILHVRKSQDVILKHLRRRSHIGGIAHAFNGSFQQAQQFIENGFALGMGGAMTFTRALQIRRLAEQLPLESLVLETDAPDIPPAWIESSANARNEPAEVAGVARVLAELRGAALEDIARTTGENAKRVLPRLGRPVI